MGKDGRLGASGCPFLDEGQRGGERFEVFDDIGCVKSLHLAFLPPMLKFKRERFCLSSGLDLELRRRNEVAFKWGSGVAGEHPRTL